MRRTLLPLLGTVMLIGCGESSQPASSRGASAPSTAVPTMEEARSQAADDIDADNVDEEFERMEREIAGDS